MVTLPQRQPCSHIFLFYISNIHTVLGLVNLIIYACQGFRFLAAFFHEGLNRIDTNKNVFKVIITIFIMIYSMRNRILSLYKITVSKVRSSLSSHQQPRLLASIVDKRCLPAQHRTWDLKVSRQPRNALRCRGDHSR